MICQPCTSSCCLPQRHSLLLLLLLQASTHAQSSRCSSWEVFLHPQQPSCAVAGFVWQSLLHPGATQSCTDKATPTIGSSNCCS
jgi:hypothetical protein